VTHWIVGALVAAALHGHADATQASQPQPPTPRPTVLTDGRPRDGFVMLPDVYDMTLNADVVVLSGCQTALGKAHSSEFKNGFVRRSVPIVVGSP
jgi:CHAT domain-containing protein